MAQMTVRRVFLIGIPLGAALIAGVAYFAHDDGTAREARLRDRADLDKKFQRAEGPADPPDVAFKILRRTFALGSAPSSVQVTSARADVLKHGDASIPFVRAAIQDGSELALFRLELIGLLGDMKGTLAENELLSILSNRTLEERFRIAAVTKVSGHSSEAVFATLRKLYAEEEAFPGRNLVLKGIAATNHPESLAVLLRAARNDANPSSRIQAVDSLGTRMSDPAALAAVRESLLRDPEENVRLASLGSLAKASDPSVSLTLKQIADDPQASPALRKAAANWMERRKAE